MSDRTWTYTRILFSPKERKVLEALAKQRGQSLNEYVYESALVREELETIKAIAGEPVMEYQTYSVTDESRSMNAACLADT